MDNDILNLNNKKYSNNNNILLQIINDLNQLMNSINDNIIIKRLSDIINKMNFIVNENKKNFELMRDDISLLYNQMNKRFDELKINMKDTIYIKYHDSKVEKINIDLCKTVAELLEEIQHNKIKDGSNILYNLIYNGKKLPLCDLLISSGIKNGDIIELTKRNCCYSICVKTFAGKNINLNVESTDTVKQLKFLINLCLGMPIGEQRLIFKALLEDNKTLADYDIQKESIIHLAFRVRG